MPDRDAIAAAQTGRPLLRSLLFAPGDSERKLAKVGTFGADAVVLDLEDAVAASQKAAARNTARTALTSLSDVTVFVRVNGLGTGLLADDVAAVVAPGLQGVMVPKLEDPGDLVEAARHVKRAEEAAGLAQGSVGLLGLIETAEGLVRVEEIARAAPARTRTLCFGQGDYSTDLSIDLTADATEVLYARSRIAVAARAAGLDQPVDGPWLGLRDLEGLRVDSARARGLGFQGRIAIHPNQVEVLNQAFGAVSDEQVRVAEAVVTAFQEAERQGLASIQVEGHFVDYPIYARAQRVLALNAAAGGGG